MVVWWISAEANDTGRLGIVAFFSRGALCSLAVASLCRLREASGLTQALTIHHRQSICEIVKFKRMLGCK